MTAAGRRTRPPTSLEPSDSCHASSPSRRLATSGSWRTSTPVRRRRPSASSITQVGPTRWGRFTRARPSWTGWSRSRSAASRSPRRPPPASGTATGSTSSTRPATSTSRSRSSARCACSTARSRCSTRSPASSRSPRPCGARPTSTTCRGSPTSTRWTASAPTSTRGVQTMIDRLGAHPVPIQLPIGAEADFRGIIDLVENHAIIYKDELGKEQEVIEIPAELADAAAAAREHLLEEVSHYDDELLEMILEEQEIPPARLKQAIRKATLAIKLTPVLCGSSFKNKGVQPLLDAVIDYLPEPARRARRSRASSPTRAPTTAAGPPHREASDDEPFAALAFKIMADPYVGKLTYFRVYSGKLAAGSRVLNVTTGRTERIGRILMMHANEREELAGGLRRRHRRRGRDQAGRHRRHAGRARQADQARDDRVPRAGDQGRDRAQDQGRPGEDVGRPRPPGRGGPDLPGPDQRGDRPDRDLRAWASCTSRCWSTGCCASSRSTPTSAARRSPTARRSAAPPRRSRAASCARPAARASTASSTSTSSRRPARALTSSTRSRAARSPPSSSPPSRRASRRRWTTARAPATRWSTSASR